MITKPHGLARLTPERRREIARQGGLAAQAKGTAHRWTSKEAADAGTKGGRETAARKAVKRLGVETIAAAMLEPSPLMMALDRLAQSRRRT